MSYQRDIIPVKYLSLLYALVLSGVHCAIGCQFFTCKLQFATLVQCACAEENIAEVDFYSPLYQPFYGVTSSEPRTWPEMRAQCNVDHIGYYLPTSCREFPLEALALCPSGILVPYAVVLIDGVFFWDSMGNFRNQPVANDDTNAPDLTQVAKNGSYAALVWPTEEVRMVGNETKFTCAVCQMARRSDVVSNGIYPPHDTSVFEYDIELVSYYQIEDISLVSNGSDLTNRLLGDLAEAFNVSVKSLRWHSAKLNENRKAVVNVFYDRGQPDADWLYYVFWNDQYLEHKSVANFETSGIKLNIECLAGKKFLTNVRRKTYLTGSVFIKTAENSLIVKECYWDADKETASWTMPIKWGKHWRRIERRTPYFDFTYLTGTNFSNGQRKHDIELSANVEQEVSRPTTNYTLTALVAGVYGVCKLHTLPGKISNVLDIMLYDLPLNAAKLLMKITLAKGKTTELARTPMAIILVSELVQYDPVVGLAMTLPNGTEGSRQESWQLNNDNKTLPPNGSHIVVTVSDSISFSAKRLAIGIYAAHLDLPNQTKRYDDSIDGWIAMVQVTFTRHKPSLENTLANDFVDIAFKPVFNVDTLRGRCAERNFTSDEWFVDNCRVLKSMRNSMLVCRCKNIYREGNFSSGTYLIYGFDARFSTYLANNKSLVIVISIVCLLSTLGLLSVILTAVVFPEWRKDQGHKIFLQMVLALTVNLVLGFVNNFFSIDTKTVACIAIGVLRHYSFLAMFFWMMVLSGLQVKRLTTIAGAKTTTHLILKVSAIAWGLPLVPIVILLAWDTGFYKSEVSNRGYCYPEDVAFQATVQVPAGVILIANLVIFVIILNHIYDWVKCNKDVVVRKHIADNRDSHLRNLGNSLFVFFLFGFTWVFHFLSEEGVINSEFLFEFLFLITASFHLFTLALFFIVFDKKTRTLWITAIRKNLRRI